MKSLGTYKVITQLRDVCVWAEARVGWGDEEREGRQAGRVTVAGRKTARKMI